MHKHKLPICPIPPNAVAEMTYIYIYIWGLPQPLLLSSVGLLLLYSCVFAIY